MSILVMSPLNVLAVSAHHDDVELGCGATLRRHADRGDNVFLVVMTKNGRAGDPTLRMNEQLLSNTILGIRNTYLLELSSHGLREQDEVIPMLKELVSGLKIDVIYTPYPSDTHSDHYHTTNALIPATRSCSILCYQLPSTVNYSPSLYIPVPEPLMKIKKDALMCHSSQVSRIVAGTDLLKWVEATGLYHAIGFTKVMANCYAEAFHVYRMLHWLGVSHD